LRQSHQIKSLAVWLRPRRAPKSFGVQRACSVCVGVWLSPDLLG
jgi:hypothetical protein